MGLNFNDLIKAGSLGVVDLDVPQPAAPDYVGAAEATSAGNLEMAREAVEANRVNQFTPWGSSTWQRPTEEGGTWTQTTSLSPEQQRLFDLNNQTSTRMGEIGLAGLGASADIFNTPFSTDQFGTVSDFGTNRQRTMDAMLSRVNSQVGQDREAASAQLIAQGIPMGSEAYNREMERIDRQLTDARQQAEIAATNQAVQESQADNERRRQMIQEALLERQTPLNELNAFRTGTQVQSPQFSDVPQMQTPLGPDYMGAATAQGQWDMGQYNADMSTQNAIVSGLFGLGSGYLAGRPR